jgi:multidrug efflux system outer membrane protein
MERMNDQSINDDRWILCIRLCCVSGCAVGPDFTEPVVQTPEAYRTGHACRTLLTDLKWWSLFDDPLLIDLVTEALTNNRDVKIAVSRIEQARAALGFTRADQYPRVDVEAGAKSLISRADFSAFVKPNNHFYLAAPLSWEIDFWGKFKRSTEAARAELFASDFGLKAVQLALVDRCGIRLQPTAGFSPSTDHLRKHAGVAHRKPQHYRAAFRKGHHRQMDVNQAQIQKEIAAAAIPLYERQHRTNRKRTRHLARPPSGNHPDSKKSEWTSRPRSRPAFLRKSYSAGRTSSRPNFCFRRRRSESVWPKRSGCRPSP